VDPALKAKGVGGELWAVHGGGFYNPQKYLVAPAHLPDELHWFKWESYSTWLSGFALISTLYYLQAGSYMVDPSVAAISPGTAVAIGLATLAGGWVVYDGCAACSSTAASCSSASSTTPSWWPWPGPSPTSCRAAPPSSTWAR
jgi:uncharacterized membrane protein